MVAAGIVPTVVDLFLVLLPFLVEFLAAYLPQEDCESGRVNNGACCLGNQCWVFRN